MSYRIDDLVQYLGDG